jgi:hypothetical protein
VIGSGDVFKRLSRLAALVAGRIAEDRDEPGSISLFPSNNRILFQARSSVS